jgi:hypothetical protein
MMLTLHFPYAMVSLFSVLWLILAVSTMPRTPASLLYDAAEQVDGAYLNRC